MISSSPTGWRARSSALPSPARPTLLLDLDQGTADIGYVPETGLLLIPMMMSDKLVAYKVQ